MIAGLKSNRISSPLGKVSQERKRHININLFGRWPLRWPGISRPGDQGSKFYVLYSEPKEHKSFSPDTRPGGPVTEATGQSFMCKSFMCLFCSLVSSNTCCTGDFGRFPPSDLKNINDCATLKTASKVKDLRHAIFSCFNQEWKTLTRSTLKGLLNRALFAYIKMGVLQAVFSS